MSERLLSPAIYIIVLAVLMSLTVLTVGLSFVPSSGIVRIVAGQTIAVIKASLVVLFFMHALRSAAQTRAVINTAIFTSSGGYQGVGFAVPIDLAKWVGGQLVASGKVHRSYLGVIIQPVTQPLAEQFKVKVSPRRARYRGSARHTRGQGPD